ncbi:MAG: hypothetical protein WDZ77_03295 [Candidatus Pacearchaeota archaeon]
MGEYIPFSESNLEKIANEEREKNKVLVLTGGTFDMVTDGHDYFLKSCRSNGVIYLVNSLGLENEESLDDRVSLIVNVRNDERVKAKKRPGSPVFEQERRARGIAMLASVDYSTVHLAIENSPTLEVAKILRPEVLVTGDKGYGEAEKEAIRKTLGYDVVFGSVPRNEDYMSTSSTFKRINSSESNVSSKEGKGKIVYS